MSSGSKTTASPVDTFKGRSILMPAFLVLFTAMYIILTVGSDFLQGIEHDVLGND